ncbi:AMP-binding protein [Leminorella grimontii]|uniref:AMP-binding protein n=1 Tax=Leminorella grimontii TaxID=82981 RepID=A0AAV5N2E6_9GAMM|nr:AMP-binding protein [Leminorella grimontii]KFC93421.1 acyl-CoA synthetase/AMP-(fatty) acid ligase [Leminorella grimontii ATCC 33999 = DSM 5078]GKX55884.1 AMP-binding protein [Leminorella grimontii]VFS54969.1 4-hydroxybenzoate--CoA/benzoate--CoA ligase [Leminorella grimontii]
MDNQKKAHTHLTLRLSDILGPDRPHNTPIAWRNAETLTLSDLRACVKTLCRQLQATQGKRWAVCFEDSYLFTAALLALIYCGKTPVIPGHLRQKQLQEQHQQGDFDGMLTDLPLQIGTPTLWISSIVHKNETSGTSLPLWPQDAEIVLFTSGSTGRPKAIRKPVSLLEKESELLVRRWGNQLSGTRIAATVTHQHLYGLTFRIFLPLAMGLPFNALLTEYHEQLQPLCSTPLTLIASPAYLKRLDSTLPPLSCALIFSAGGPLEFEDARLVKQSLNALPHEIYGTSETGVIATRCQRDIGSLWKPMDGITVHQQEDGTIDVVSPLFDGDAGKTIHDLIELHPEGFYLLGRKDRIVKIEEKRLSLTDVEQRLMALDVVRDAAVLPVTQGRRSVLAAVIVLTSPGERRRRQNGDNAVISELRQSLREWLEPVALPRRWRIVDEIPHNAQSKRAYSELQELFL